MQCTELTTPRLPASIDPHAMNPSRQPFCVRAPAMTFRIYLPTYRPTYHLGMKSSSSTSVCAVWRLVLVAMAIMFIASSHFLFILFADPEFFTELSLHAPNAADELDAPAAPLTDAQPRTQKPLEYNHLGVARSAQFPAYTEIDTTAQANVCFFLQLSEPSLPLAPRLLSRLWHEQNVVLIHVDAKVSDSALATLQTEVRKPQFNNVHLIPRETITYAGISMLLNTMGAMEYALNLQQPWDYFINLSGSDYPMVSATSLRTILGQPRVLQQQVSFVQLSWGHKFWNTLKRARFDTVHIDPALGLPPNSRQETKLLYTRKPHPQADTLRVDFVHSEAWLTAHRSMVIEAARGNYARRLLPLLANTKDPEEHFFAMLGWNTALNRTMARHAGRRIFWELNGVKAGQHPYWVDDKRGASGAYTLWPHIAESPCFFVRKFKHANSPLMDQIDAQLSGITPLGKLPAAVSQTSVDRKRRRLAEYTMCMADIERHWYNPSFKICS